MPMKPCGYHSSKFGIMGGERSMGICREIKKIMIERKEYKYLLLHPNSIYQDYGNKELVSNAVQSKMFINDDLYR